MDGFFQVCGLCGLAIAFVALIRSRPKLRQTTLTTAANWSIAAVGCWLACWIADSLLASTKPGLIDRLWYATAVLSLCAPMSVLGARRPTARVWPWFVVLPMIVVLMLPLASSWQTIDRVARLQMETPVLVGFGLVLIMSVGNYVGTRYSLSALLFIAAMLLSIASVAAAVPETVVTVFRFRLLAVALLSTAVFMAGFSSRQLLDAPTGSTAAQRIQRLDNLWADFRNTFGIVWAKRIEERVNAVAAKEQWPARLQTAGIVWIGENNESPTDEQIEQTAERMELTIRWLLRRFCEPEWIDARMKPI